MKRILWPGILILMVAAILIANILLFVVALRNPPQPVNMTTPAGEVRT